jgi:hypothetical protein
MDMDYDCEDCGATFSTRQALGGHRGRHSALKRRGPQGPAGAAAAPAGGEQPQTAKRARAEDHAAEELRRALLTKRGGTPQAAHALRAALAAAANSNQGVPLCIPPKEEAEEEDEDEDEEEGGAGAAGAAAAGPAAAALHAPGPQPLAAPGCLSGHALCITGQPVLMTREEYHSLALRLGGRCFGSVNGFTTILVHARSLEDGRP